MTVLKKCHNNTWFHLNVYLILITLCQLCVMILNRKKFTTLWKRTRLSKRLLAISVTKKLQTKAHSFSAYNKWCIKTLAWHNSKRKNKCHLKIRFCADAYFDAYLHCGQRSLIFCLVKGF